ncbi:MAG: hypothetical protein E7235_06610 [Lachnospiraceae bacterium]|nr:hypothetical protein [Lachnospiraceae bacterium]
MDKITYIGFGDSLTYGYGVISGVSFMDKLKKSLPEEFSDKDWTIINSGINGDTTREGLRRIYRDVIDHDPDIVTILFGSNDSAFNDYQHRAITEFELNLAEITRLIQKNTKAKIIFITPPPLIEDEIFPFTTNKAVSAYSEVIRKNADNFACELIDFNTIMSMEAKGNLEPYLQYDGLHLSEKGYELIYKFIMNKIKSII